MYRFALILCLACGFTLDAAADTGDVAAGEAAYAETCSRCHRDVTRVARQLPGATAAEKSTWLETFLTDHHAEDVRRRADLIAYLTRL